MACPIGQEAAVCVGLETEEIKSGGVIGNSKAAKEKTREKEGKEKRISSEHCWIFKREEEVKPSVL